MWNFNYTAFSPGSAPFPPLVSICPCVKVNRKQLSSRMTFFQLRATRAHVIRTVCNPRAVRDFVQSGQVNMTQVFQKMSVANPFGWAQTKGSRQSQQSHKFMKNDEQGRRYHKVQGNDAVRPVSCGRPAVNE